MRIHFFLVSPFHHSCKRLTMIVQGQLRTLLVASFLFAPFITIGNKVYAQLVESDRLQVYHDQGYSWPPREEEYTPNTPGWRRIFERRFRQLDGVDTKNNSYNGYMAAIHSGLLCPNYTESGWGLTRAPVKIVKELQQSLHQGLEDEDTDLETMEVCIGGNNRPLYVPQDELNIKVLAVVQPIVEAWTGVKLIGTTAYGLRVYRNESDLNMHIDNVHTHIHSAILHVDHDPDGDPWPIVIEDYEGNTNEVYMEPGDMLLYESSKNYHGRPTIYNGSWYSSIFIHYYPVDWDVNREDKTHYRVPPIWADSFKDAEVEDLEVVGTSLKESTCPFNWCAMSNSVIWHGPGEAYGVVQSTHGRRVLDLPPEDELPHLHDEL